ncbi:hypothetical protein QQF64_031522 [Cirrhinus molitorella]|uniref:Sulfotransferase n=1 Tax=Cirrhinus molitorella TaxID=172907 RepID=A0ABR3MX61_9TELE
MNMVQPEPGNWNTFLQKFMEGKNVFGPWYDHVNGWIYRKSTNNIIEIPDLSSMKLPSRPELFDFEGVSMVHYFTDNWEKVKNFQARHDDILIATYPKAGLTLIGSWNLPEATPCLVS